MTPKNNNAEGAPKAANTLSNEAQQSEETRAARAYVSPEVLSHSGEDILEELGPAQACYPFNSCGVTP